MLVFFFAVRRHIFLPRVLQRKTNHHGAGGANHCEADASPPRPSPDCLSKGSYDHFVNEGRWVTITRHSIHLGCASQSNKGVAARMSVPSIQDLPHTYRHRRARFKPMLPCSCPLAAWRTPPVQPTRSTVTMIDGRPGSAGDVPGTAATAGSVTITIVSVGAASYHQ